MARNTGDKSTLKRYVQGLQGRFGIEDVTFVTDRGVVSSTKERKEKLARHLLVEDVAGSDQVRTREIYSEEGRRYILCLNEGIGVRWKI